MSDDKVMKGRVSEDFCNHCQQMCTPEGHDFCIGTLPPPVMNACCGHGDNKVAYVQLDHDNYKQEPNAFRLEGDKALDYIKKYKDNYYSQNCS